VGFVWDVWAEMWGEGYAHLLAFRQIEGHVNVPLRFRTSDGYGLGSWVGRQREMRRAQAQEHASKRTRKGGLTHRQIERLEEIGFDWEPVNSAWNVGYLRLREFVSREGHALVPGRHLEQGFALGKWVSHKRVAAKAGALTQERRAQLTALGFVWDVLEYQWEAGYTKLAAYSAREDMRGCRKASSSRASRSVTGLAHSVWLIERAN
jgi:hypothetical protein